MTNFVYLIGYPVRDTAANTIFASCSGSTSAACAVVGKASIPVMKKTGYSDAMSTGVIAASLFPELITSLPSLM